MTLPNFKQASTYACTRLARELSPCLFYHALSHTRDDVVPAAQRLARQAGVVGEEALLLSTAAWYHDLGFVVQRTEHEVISAEIAAATLPQFGYTPQQIASIRDIIMSTRLPQSPHTLLEQLMADADLDSLGRDDFLQRSHALHAELALVGDPIPLCVWYQRQLRFLSEHRYFTHAARTLREPTKQRNIAQLRALVANTSQSTMVACQGV